MSANFLKNFMDLDEFLAVKDLCTGLSRTESDYAEDEGDQDLVNFIDEEDIPSECSLSQFDSSSTPLATPTFCGGGNNSSDTDEGRGESICSSENISACSSSESMSSLNSSENYKSPRRKRKVKHVNNTEKATPRKRRRKTSDGAKKKADGANTCPSSGNTGRPRHDKQSVDETAKDDKYWERRRKNNQAAKRSRDLKRLREMNVKERAAYLEEENRQLRDEVQKLKEYLKTLDEKVDKSS